MGTYDDISPDQLRSDLVDFARLILKLDENDQVLASPADLQRLLGELRQKLFAYEIRSSHFNIQPSGSESGAEGSRPAEQDPVVRNSLRVVREALRRTEEMLQEWEGRGSEPTDEDEDE